MTAKRDEFLARLDAMIRQLHRQAGTWDDESARVATITGMLIARRMYLNQPLGPGTRDQALAGALDGPLLDPDEPLGLTPAEAQQLGRALDDGQAWGPCLYGNHRDCAIPGCPCPSDEFHAGPHQAVVLDPPASRSSPFAADMKGSGGSGAHVDSQLAAYRHGLHTMLGNHPGEAVMDIAGLKRVSGRRCPDSGACHHDCTKGCFRVRWASPLSAAGWGDMWPEDVRRANEDSDGML